MRVKDKPFGVFGGSYLPESLMPTVLKLKKAYYEAKDDPEFNYELKTLLQKYSGRQTPLYLAKNLTEIVGGAKIYLKREDLNHTGSHKINNVLGQLLLAKRMGFTKVMAETGAGQHGVATATGAALFSMECTVFMGKEDIERQRLNVKRMRLLGAKVVEVTSGSMTLKDATNEAIRSWSACAQDTFYCIGSVVGPSPYPEMVQHFQSVIGRECKAQYLEEEGKHPKAIVACVGGGSNAAGIFDSYIIEEDVELFGAEAGGEGLNTSFHGAAINKGRIGVIQGMKTYVLQDEAGNIQPAYSISAGLDYPGVGPLHAKLHESGRACYEAITDDEAKNAFLVLTKAEGIIPALESAHALALGMKVAKRYEREDGIVVLLSGRGDKDVDRI
ncbi:tryptophan synthase subunit beta [Clostridia bacterium]|nr:tryptophan synthase subunit beta [Clostridia bacterium]